MNIIWKNDKEDPSLIHGYVNEIKECSIYFDSTWYHYIPYYNDGCGISEQALFSIDDAKEYAEENLSDFLKKYRFKQNNESIVK